MMLMNPPWRLEEQLRPVLAALAEPGQARVSSDWLVPEWKANSSFATSCPAGALLPGSCPYPASGKPLALQVLM